MTIYERALAKRGLKLQLVVLMEECGELIQACSKWVRGIELKNWDFYPTNICEEIADVELLIEQVKVSKTGIREDVEDFKKDKLKRLEEVLGKEPDKK